VREVLLFKDFCYYIWLEYPTFLFFIKNLDVPNIKITRNKSTKFNNDGITIFGHNEHSRAVRYKITLSHEVSNQLKEKYEVFRQWINFNEHIHRAT
jgi:hypothetical protein